MTAGGFSSPTRRAMIAGGAALFATGATQVAGDPIVSCRAGRFQGGIGGTGEDAAT